MESTSKPFYNMLSILEPSDSHQGAEAHITLLPLDVLTAVLYLVVCITGLTGNCLVMAAVVKLDRMGTATTVYIFNLALADGLFMVGLPFIAFQNLQNSWPFGNLACRLVMVLDGINQFTSVFCLTVMSVDRCLAAADPLRFSAWHLPNRAKLVSLLLWPLSLLPTLPMALHFSAESGQCILDPHEALDSWWLAFIACAFALGFALPFAIMSASYIMLALSLRAHQAPGSQQFEKQATRMVGAVVLAFAACWLPFYTVNFYTLFQRDPVPAVDLAFRFAVLLSYSWSCANPIIYACFSDAFRKHFRTLLCPAEWLPGCDTNTEAFDLCNSSAGEMTTV